MYPSTHETHHLDNINIPGLGDRYRNYKEKLDLTCLKAYVFKHKKMSGIDKQCPTPGEVV